MSFWHDLITQKSFEVLIKLKKNLSFTLIGGWAIFLYTHALKSKDIDIIIDYPELEKLRQGFPLSKNERLKKYEIKQEGIDIDIYLPHFSNPGLPAEEILKHTAIVENFKVPRIEVLLLLKQHAFAERKGSLKGEKDKLDILSLLKSDLVDLKQYLRLLGIYKKSTFQGALKDLLLQTASAPEVGLNPQATAKLKKRILPFLRLSG